MALILCIYNNIDGPEWSHLFFSVEFGLGVGHGERGVRFRDVFVKRLFIVVHVAGSHFWYRLDGDFKYF